MDDVIIEELTELRDQVAALRVERDNLEARVKAATQAAIERVNEEHATELLALSYVEDELEGKESQLREGAVANFLETGNKKPIPGVGVREVAVVEYRDTEALSWAKRTGLCLKLDAPAFKRVAKANLAEVPALIKKVPQGTISRDLLKVVGIIPKEKAQ